MFEYAKGRLKNRFFPKKCPLDDSLRPPPEKRQYLKIPEIDFFPNIRFDMLSVVQGPQPRTRSLRIWAYFRFLSSADMPCLSRATNEYQLYLPKATLEAVFDRSVKKEKTCCTLQGLESMVYFRHLKVAKKSIFFRGWRNVTGQNHYPQTSKGRFLGKIDL